VLRENCGRLSDLSHPCTVLCAAAGPQYVSVSSEQLQADVRL